MNFTYVKKEAPREDTSFSDFQFLSIFIMAIQDVLRSQAIVLLLIIYVFLCSSNYAFARASPSASHSAPAASSGVALQITGSQAMVTPRVMQSLSQVRIHSPSPHP